MRSLLGWLVLLGACTSGDPEDPAVDYPFTPFVGRDTAPDAATERLCVEPADPRTVEAQVFIDCDVEGSNHGLDAPATPPSELVVWAYNLERGFHLDEHIALATSGAVPAPDILLASELDRGCARTDGRNVGWELAEALGMHHAYAVEFVELPRPDDMGIAGPSCEHGNLVASRFPLGNVEAVRHATNKSWYDAGERRLGGRIAIHADIALGGDRYLSVASVHFESSPADVDIQIEQARQTAELLADSSLPAIGGGDTNAPFYGLDLLTGGDADQTIAAFLDLGFADAHLGIDPADRGTIDAGFIIDLILTRDVEVVEAGICPAEMCGGLSDHLPVWARVRVP